MNIEGDRTTHYIDLTFFMAKSALSEMGLGSDAVAQRSALHIDGIYTQKCILHTHQSFNTEKAYFDSQT